MQLPVFQAKSADPGAKSKWAELRQAQAAALALPDTGQAVIIDLGEEADVHPRDKSPVGDRLARVALARAYGRSIPWAGPAAIRAKVESHSVRVSFDYVESGLAAKPLPASYRPLSLRPETVPMPRSRPAGELEGYALRDPGGTWHWAEARIEGKDVVVSCKDVPRPVAIRYAWADNPTCNLYNGDGLPAAPFEILDVVP